MNKKITPGCSTVKITLDVIGGKWKSLILFLLSGSTMRFSELQRGIEGITQKMLTQQLRELESDKLISRKIYAQVPPKVEYTLTLQGKSLLPVLKSMAEWGSTHK